jgi:penicillin-binding protein 2
MSSDDSRHRLGLLAIAAVSLFGALFARLWFLQIVEGQTLEERVTSNVQKVVVIPAPRGRILDRTGLVLVDNRESIVVGIDFQAFAEMEEADQDRLLDRLSTTLSRGKPDPDRVTVSFLRKRLNDGRFSHLRPVPVAEDVSVSQEIFFKEQADLFPAVTVERHAVRSYPYGSLAAHVLGYVGSVTEDQWKAFQRKNDPRKPYIQSDEIGKAGVEKIYESNLRGTPGRQVYEVDRAGQIVREIESRRRPAKAGDDLYLSIDARLQYKTEEALQARIEASDSPTPAGAASVIDPRNGQVLAMASFPTYDPSTLVGGISNELWTQLNDPKTKTLSNRSVQEAYPAASTFKLASSYAGLRLGIIAPDEVVVDQGVFSLCDGDGPGCKKRNSGGGEAMGPITLSTALTRSSDYYFYRVGVSAWSRHKAGAAPEDALQREIEQLGYGEKTGIGLAGETPGRVPSPQTNRELADAIWDDSHANYDNDEAIYQDARRWKAGYSADIAIGQFDVLVSPLQTANAYASLANGQGRLYRPQLLDRITRSRKPFEIVVPFEAEVKRTIDWGEWRQALLDGFAGVTHTPGGTAFRVFEGFPLDQFSVSGKTGTAEVGDDATQKRDNSLFVGFGPNPDNQYVASVMIEGGGFGAEAAAPAVRMIMESIANGDKDRLVVPRGGAIDAEAAAEASSDIGTGGAD